MYTTHTQADTDVIIYFFDTHHHTETNTAHAYLSDVFRYRWLYNKQKQLVSLLYHYISPPMQFILGLRHGAVECRVRLDIKSRWYLYIYASYCLLKFIFSSPNGHRDAIHYYARMKCRLTAINVIHYRIIINVRLPSNTIQFWWNAYHELQPGWMQATAFLPAACAVPAGKSSLSIKNEMTWTGNGI